MAIIEPTGAVLKALKPVRGSSNLIPDLMVFHTTNTASCVKWGIYSLVPTNVSFRGLSVGEGSAEYVHTAVLINTNVLGNYPPHLAGGLRPVRHFAGNPNCFARDETGIKPTASFHPTLFDYKIGSNATDRVLLSDLIKLTLVVDIPILRRYKTMIYTNGTVHSEKTIFRNGNVEIMKWSSTYFRYQSAYGDPTTP